MSIRRRALDLLFIMCTPDSSAEIVEELLGYLTLADFSMREELVLKTAVLAERCVAGPGRAARPADILRRRRGRRSARTSAPPAHPPCALPSPPPYRSFLPSLEWYVDSMLTLMERAGESSMNDLWHSVVQVRAVLWWAGEGGVTPLCVTALPPSGPAVHPTCLPLPCPHAPQLVTNHPQLHLYAARKSAEALQRGASHEVRGRGGVWGARGENTHAARGGPQA